MTKAPAKTGRKKPGRDLVAEIKDQRPPNEREAEALAQAKASFDQRPLRPQLKRGTQEPGVLDVRPPHNDAKGMATQLHEAFGSTADDFLTQNLLALANLHTADGKINIEGINVSVALLAAIAPQNELEATLAMNMTATHELSMLMLRRAKNTEHLQGMQQYGNLATKLSRTFVAQMKALSDWRRGGEQVVRHIHVNAGGQAVVAETVNVGGSQNNADFAGQCHALGTALPRSNEAGYLLPSASDPRQAPLSDARRQESGSAEG